MGKANEANRQARDRARTSLATLKSCGAISATFHPDGSIASVNFGTPIQPQVTLPQAKPAAIIEEALTRTFKTDVEALDLPGYEDSN